jgi:opacity protein-like surface antigen
MQFSGTRPEFDAWVEANRAPLLAILFPVSLSEGATGIDVAQNISQSFLLSTALAAGGRGRIGGRVEWEAFDTEQYPGNAIQGLFRMGAVAVEARFTQLDDPLDTRSFRGGVNVHPYWRRTGATTEWRAGADGYFSTLYSTSSALDLGSLDYGAGGWASGRVELTRASVSFGGILLGSNSHIPLGLVSDTYDFVAEAMNERPLRWDLTIGGGVETPLSTSVAIGAQFLHSQLVGGEFRPAQFTSTDDGGRTSQLFLADIAYLIASDRRLDFGYRYSTGGDRYRAHGIFINANFAF